jgi:2-oxoglutarate/2-oxoacid ferredoxin oxidoreductase subunit alpha
MGRKTNVIELDEAVIRFSGDSGDGMQLTGTLFSDTAALFGNDISTFPDYPAEIRAPQGTVGGVSGFQVHLGRTQIDHPGDFADILVAMNPAAFKVNLRWVKPGGTIIVDIDSFTEKNIEKAGYSSDPLTDKMQGDFNIIKAPISTLTRECLQDLGLDNKSILRSKNMFALGICFWLFDKETDHAEKYFEKKFKSKQLVIQANKMVLEAGYNFAETIEALQSTYIIAPADVAKGTYRNINGNVATAWGLMAGAEKSGLKLFCGSYPITPATEILQELSNHKELDVVTFQAEDEIAGICTTIGASFAGKLGVTTTSGPGLALKSEAMGLAVITELPLVVVDVQRGGPSTGLPTKTEQSDLLQALYGRNGESPMVVVAASTPSNCFDYAFEACRLTLEHMTPVVLLTDGFIANGSEPWKLPKMANLPNIQPRIAKEGTDYKPYARDPETLAREWGIPGTKGLEHRLGSLEKMDITGTVSYVPENHQVMTNYRAAKLDKIQQRIPKLTVSGNETADLLVVGWGSTYGHLVNAVRELQVLGKSISLAHFNYINPLPANVAEIFSNFKKIVVCELNMGQFASYLRSKLPQFEYIEYHKVQGLPFTIVELKNHFNQLLEEK